MSTRPIHTARPPARKGYSFLAKSFLAQRGPGSSERMTAEIPKEIATIPKRFLDLSAHMKSAAKRQMFDNRPIKRVKAVSPNEDTVEWYTNASGTSHNVLPRPKLTRSDGIERSRQEIARQALSDLSKACHAKVYKAEGADRTRSEGHKNIDEHIVSVFSDLAGDDIVADDLSTNAVVHINIGNAIDDFEKMLQKELAEFEQGCKDYDQIHAELVALGFDILPPDMMSAVEMEDKLAEKVEEILSQASKIQEPLSKFTANWQKATEKMLADTMGNMNSKNEQSMADFKKLQKDHAKQEATLIMSLGQPKSV